MVICHCNAINDAAIRAEIEAGAVDVEDVTARCGAGDRCGSCRPVIEALLVTVDACAVSIRSAAA